MKDTGRRTEFRQHVGKKIRYFREKSGLTQMQLAFMSDLDRSFIQNVEHGRQSISFENMWKIARCLKRELTEFVPSLNEEFHSDE